MHLVQGRGVAAICSKKPKTKYTAINEFRFPVHTHNFKSDKPDKSDT
jgi:hypothetical protein